MMKIIASNNKMMPNLFLAFVIFMLALIALRSKNNSISRILTHFSLINKFLNVTVAGPDHIWLVFSQKADRFCHSGIRDDDPDVPDSVFPSPSNYNPGYLRFLPARRNTFPDDESDNQKNFRFLVHGSKSHAYPESISDSHRDNLFIS